ncbi:enoyl-CoA delta isomerase 1, mitochondrial-like [Atheta coriaria]|uniref:enoyl-CoA delta isomerase 1, mitochondrial-like n=1 Tax=Dalotia coriaria TaxID=877792 RepID=UPI0031F42825
MLKSVRKIAPLYNGFQHIRNSSKFVDIAVSNQGIATVTMQRKPVNSLNLELLTQLHEAFEQVENDNAKGMILTSGSDTVFSAGLDIMEMYKPDQERVKNFWSTLQDTWLKLYGLSTPTCAVINGHSPAGGCLLAMSCEYRIMSQNFTIGLNETKLGIVAPEWFIASMRNTISNRETELALTAGRLFTTDEALKIGLIDEVATSKEDGIAKSANFFKMFAKVNPLARQMTKTVCRKKDLQQLIDNKEEDLQQFLFFVNQPLVQKGLDMYIEALKKKAKN